MAASTSAGILSHMNKDHSDSVLRYVQHYHKLSGWRAYGATMTNIDLNGFDIRASGQTYRVPFHPPMKSLSEARTRLVDMDKYSTRHLDKSDLTVKSYIPPYGKFLVGAVLTLGFVYASTDPSWYAPQGVIGKHLGDHLQPIVQQIVTAISPKLLKYLAIIHAAEVVYFTRAVLPKYNVTTRQPAFYLWAISILFEGIGAQLRFKEQVEKLRAAKDKQRH